MTDLTDLTDRTPPLWPVDPPWPIGQELRRVSNPKNVATFHSWSPEHQYPLTVEYADGTIGRYHHPRLWEPT